MTELILSTLSIYAITLVLSSYSGPFHVFSLMRNKSPEMLKELLECFVCLSWYVALSFTLLLGLNILEYMAVVGGAIVLWKVSER